MAAIVAGIAGPLLEAAIQDVKDHEEQRIRNLVGLWEWKDRVRQWEALTEAANRRTAGVPAVRG